MRVTELADKCRARLGPYGFETVEVAGWQSRGFEFPSRPDGAMRHWTAGGAGTFPSFNVLVHGRSGLPGPLCAVAQSREPDGNDKAYVIASGKANHAGEGHWNGMSGNYEFLGLEIEWSGPGEHFPARRKLCSELIMRALMDCTAGTNQNDACEHREYAPTRKIDTNLSGDELRARMVQLLEDDMPITDAEFNRIADTVIAKLAAWDGYEALAWRTYGMMLMTDPVDPHIADGRREPNHLARKLLAIEAKVESLTTITGADPDALAEKVADLLAERLAT